MTSFDKRWLMVGLAPYLLGATPDSTVPPAFAARVAEAVASAWRIEPGAVHLEWHGAASDSALGPETSFRLAGRGADGWFVVVVTGSDPTALRVRAGVEDMAPVATRPLSAGARIEDGDLRAERRVCWGPPARTATDRLAEVGWEMRRSLAAGEVVSWPAASPPAWVAAGDPVRLTWDRGGVSIWLKGVALHAARRGERVRARVEGRERVVAATVTAPGVAAIMGDPR